MNKKRELETVQEEYLESEVDTPCELPDLQHKRPSSNSKLSRTQPVTNIAHNYNTINATTVPKTVTRDKN